MSFAQPEQSESHPTRRFSNRVDFYLRARPRYPAALLRFLQTELKLSPTHAIADIGSGTGFLAQPFVANGNLVYGVEPNADMRQAAEQLLADWSNFRSIDGTAEATTLPSGRIDFVTAGQAFHWFDPVAARAEFQRILVPGGQVVLVWNQRRQQTRGFNDEYGQLVRDYEIVDDHHAKKSVTATNLAVLGPFFGAGGHRVATFDNPQALDLSGLKDRLTSSSNMPPPGHPRHPAMLAAAENLFGKYEQSGVVTLEHETNVFYGLLS